MSRLFSILILLVSLLCFSGCGDEDTTPPVWEFHSFNPEPRSGEICGELEPEVFFVKGGDVFEFHATFTDDEELSQYKIDIHQNFDCHGHGKTLDWYVLDIIELSGKEEEVHKQLEVPENVTAGKYHFMIYLVDAAGNQAVNTFIRDFVVLNPTDTIPPEVLLTTPNPTENHVVERGTSLNFSGTVTDNLSLYEGGNGKIVIDFVNQSNQNIFDGAEFAFPPTLSTTYDFDLDVDIPLSAPTGDYIFRVYAFDGVNNRSERIFVNVEVE